MNISIGARTDVGGRSNNEDCLAVLDRERVPLRADAVLVVADGMGGRANGEQASGIAVKVVRETIMDMLNPENDKPLPPAEDILSAAFRRANSMVYELSQEHPDTPGMGTTCTAAIVSEGILTLAHVGDSRAYMIRGASIRPLTTDHTYVADQVKSGNMSNEAAKSSRFRNVITRAIGITPTIQPDFENFPLMDADTILLCTDGLSSTLKEGEILEVVSRSSTAQTAAVDLVDAAKACGVKDNVTVITIRCTADVQAGRLVRDRPEPEFNGSGPKETPKPKPAPDRQPPPPKPGNRRRSPIPYEAITTVAVALIVGAALAAGIFFEIGWLKIPDNAFDGLTDSGAEATDYLSLDYQSPTRVFYKSLRPNFLMVSADGVFVALDQSGKVIHLNSQGQPDGKAPADAIAPPALPVPTYYAVDAAGNMYESSGWSGSIVQVSADGAPRRTVVTNLTKPEAIAVDETGDIFVIDNGKLFEVRSKPGSGSS